MKKKTGHDNHIMYPNRGNRVHDNHIMYPNRGNRVHDNHISNQE